MWGKNNIWSLVAKKNEKPTTKSPKLDFGDMENLFCQQVAPPPEAAKSAASAKETSATDGKKKEEVRKWFFKVVLLGTKLPSGA